MSKRRFEELVAKGNQVGEIVGVDRFLVRVRGLQPINVHSLIMFEDGSKGYVHHIFEDHVVVLHLGQDSLRVGMVAVLQHDRLVAKVGKNYIGRVISIFGEPLDGKGPIVPDDTWPVFHNAPMLHERELLDSQLETGVTTLDIMFSLLRGQRMAILGDSKSGKTTLTTQIAINQRSTDIVVVYVLIAKRHSDVSELLDRLQKNNALEKAIVVVSTMFESLITSYLAPYVACAMGEYLWQACQQDTLVIYDDLTSHAQAYREISLIAGVSPGRDSYPGDTFYIHSQLVERAGKLSGTGASQTALPIVYAPNGDITAYLPTNIMSMTDGQWILDMEVFRDTMRPAISTGLSVTRVGGAGQNKRQKQLSMQMAQALAAYYSAEEYAHFGSELSDEATQSLSLGKALFSLLNQVTGETYSLMSQQLMLDILLNAKPDELIDVPKMKSLVAQYAEQVNDEAEEKGNFDQVRDQLKALCLMTPASEIEAATSQPTDQNTDQDQPEAEKSKKSKKSKKSPPSTTGDKDKQTDKSNKAKPQAGSSGEASDQSDSQSEIKPPKISSVIEPDKSAPSSDQVEGESTPDKQTANQEVKT